MSTTMAEEEDKVRYFAVVGLVAGLLTAILFLVSFGTTEWLHFPISAYHGLMYIISFGLWKDQWCRSGLCGITRFEGFDDVYGDLMNTPEGNGVKGLMCAALSFMVVAVGCNVIILAVPGKIMAVLTSIFWLLAGIANAVSVILFNLHFGGAYQEYFGWSFWLSVVSSLVFLILGLCFCFFICCFRWYRPPRHHGPHVTDGTGSSAVVYGNEASTSMMTPAFTVTPPAKNDVSNSGYGSNPGSNINYRI